MTKSRAVRKHPETAPKTTPVRRSFRESDRPARVLVTAGPTQEPIDDVRFIGNRSSGAMGIALADEAAARGTHCTLLLGPTSLTPTHSSVRVLRFRTTAQLQALLHREFPHCDILVMAAAVADYRPIARSKGKLPRRGRSLVLRLEPTPDLLAGLKPIRRDGQLLVGFALEPERTMLSRAAAKLARKGLDLIVANPLETMESPRIRATVLSASGTVLRQRSPVSKRIFARKLVGMLLRSPRAATLS